MMLVLEARGLTKVYGGRGKVATRALNNLSLQVHKGEFLGIMGPSGSGKTTLLNLLATIDRPTSGSVAIEGTDVSQLQGEKLALFRRRRLGFVFQDYNLLDSLTIGENIALPLVLDRVPVRVIKERLRLLAGTVPVTGPGVVVTLAETPEAVTAKNRVADEDIWRVVNELYTAGAEAIAVGGVRLTSVSGIRNVGERILVNETMIASPVEIHAIGDPAVLDASLKLRGGVIDLLARWGIKVTVVKSDSLTLPPLKTSPSFMYAKPVESSGS